MAFTTATVDKVEQGVKQFGGVFKEMWVANLTVNPASIAAGAEDTATFTIPNVALGDMIIGWAAGVSLTATGEADVNVFVSAANTITVRITNLHASSAVDLGSSTWKVVIGRPAF